MKCPKNDHSMDLEKFIILKVRMSCQIYYLAKKFIDYVGFYHGGVDFGQKRIRRNSFDSFSFILFPFNNNYFLEIISLRIDFI